MRANIDVMERVKKFYYLRPEKNATTGYVPRKVVHV
jgi:hypothetical protein